MQNSVLHPLLHQNSLTPRGLSSIMTQSLAVLTRSIPPPHKSSFPKCSFTPLTYSRCWAQSQESTTAYLHSVGGSMLQLFLWEHVYVLMGVLTGNFLLGIDLWQFPAPLCLLNITGSCNGVENLTQYMPLTVKTWQTRVLWCVCPLENTMHPIITISTYCMEQLL